ncbi:class I SAM-dependent methyltransferase [Streptomyces sp. NPDC094149]|uniref:class I SAM-dependent methyltransferase n=1 Tax=Streptomyces sp. NPDC094149 TaxID=3155079 RepID=UPI00332127AB
MSRGYAVAYALNLTPWERAGTSGAAALDRLIARAETELGGPGRALDLGCGSGLHLVALAQRGWQATGVELIGKAVRRARARVADAGAEARVLQGDVTALDRTAVGGPYHLLLDIGCFHGLDDEQRAAMGRSATAVAAPEALMILLSFRPGAVPKPLPRGADSTDIGTAFPGWHVIDSERAPTEGMPAPLRKAAPTFHLVRRTA